VRRNHRIFVALVLIAGTRSVAGQRPDRVAAQPDSLASDAQFTATASVTTFDSAGRSWRRYVNQRFMPEYTLVFTGRWPPQNLLLHETATYTCCGEDQEHRNTFTVTAFRDSIAKLFGPIWQATVVADKADTWSESFYRAVLYGCCAQSDKVMFVSLRSGRTIFVSSGEPWDLPTIDVPNGGGLSKRFAAFHDLFTPDDPPEARATPDLVGVLQYGPLDGPTTRVLVHCSDTTAEGKRELYQLDSLAFRVEGKDSRQAYLWASNRDTSAAALTGFQIHLTIVPFNSLSHARPSILVPVVHDSVDTAHAILPSSCRLSLTDPGAR
jgi:hypothetical protein